MQEEKKESTISTIPNLVGVGIIVLMVAIVVGVAVFLPKTDQEQAKKYLICPTGGDRRDCLKADAFQIKTEGPCIVTPEEAICGGFSVKIQKP